MSPPRISSAAAGGLIIAALLFWHHGWLVGIADGIANPGDPLLTAWILAWNGHQLVRDPLRLFQANSFHPHEDTLAFSEHLFAPALLVAPVQWLGGNPILAQNVSILLAQVLFGLGVFVFCRGFHVSVVASAAAALLAALGPARMARLGHLHLIHLAGLPFLLHFLHRYLRCRKWRDLLLAGVFLNAQMLSGYYLAAMAAMSAALFCVLRIARWRRQRVARYAGRLLLIGAVTAVVNLPFVIPYFRVSSRWRFTRTVSEAETYAASLSDLARRPSGLLFLPDVSVLGRPHYEKVIYPGIALVLLGFAALRRTARKRRGAPPERFLTVYAACGAGLALLLALGPTLRLAGLELPMPYRLLYSFVPGFQGLRAPARFGLMLDFHLCLLAAAGVSVLVRKAAAGARSRRAPWLAASLLVLAAVERVPSPSQPAFRIETGARLPPVYRWLAARPELRRLVFLPAFNASPPSGMQWDPTPYRELYFSTFHWKQMINGVSGFVPPGYLQQIILLQSLPDPTAIAELQRLAIDAVVIHRRYFAGPLDPRSLAGAGLEVIYESPDSIVLRWRPAASGPESGSSATMPARRE